MSSSGTNNNSRHNLLLLETFQMYLKMSLLCEKNLKMLLKTNIILPFNRRYFSNTAQVITRYWCLDAI